MERTIKSSKLFGHLVAELAQWYQGPYDDRQKLVDLHNQIWPDSPIVNDEVNWEQ